MHRLLPPGVPSQGWSPSLSPRLLRLLRPLRRFAHRRIHQIVSIEVRGLHHLRRALDAGHGVLVTPNHHTYVDPLILSEAADRANTAFYYMTAWQVFASSNWLKRQVLRRSGCFSVDRDGADLRAFRQAVAIIKDRPHPLVIFPEGEMYHVGDRVMPFHDGAAAIALNAAKHAPRSVACVPCAIKYYFVEDPTPKLQEIMGKLEQRLFWRPRTDLPLEQRLFQIAEGALALKELEYLGQTRAGPVSERIAGLCETVLTRLEARYALEVTGGSVPQRVTALRRRALARLSELEVSDDRCEQYTRDLDNVHFVTQLFSYPPDYVAERPSLERISETLARLQEDLLGEQLATSHGPTGAVVAFDEPILVGPGRGPDSAHELTRLLESTVQRLLQMVDVPSIARRKGERSRFEVNDVQSRLNATRVDRLVRPTSVEELRDALREADRDQLAVSVSGGRHAMGGQQFGAGTMLIDTRGLSQVIQFDYEGRYVDVGGGIEWPELLQYLHNVQAGRDRPISIRQKQTGIDRVTIGGSLAANGHGRGLRFPPLAADVESFMLMTADGNLVRCSRAENRELFSLVLGGYGLFGIVTEARLRLVPRQKVRRAVKVIKVAELQAEVNRRLAEGFLYGDCQYSTDLESPASEHTGVFSCYAPVPDETPIKENQRYLSEEEWSRLYGLARADKKRAFETYARYYLSTDGQVYWSDTHQVSGGIDYYNQVLERQRGVLPNNTEMITEVYVTWDKLLPFLAAVREDFRQDHADLTYGTIRFIERDEDSFLAWAVERQVCVLCNLNVVHTEAGRKRAAETFRRLFDRVAQYGGRYFLTYHRWATKEQVVACYPQFVDFLRLKRKYDPGERFQSEWYRHYRDMFAKELA